MLVVLVFNILSADALLKQLCLLSEGLASWRPSVRLQKTEVNDL